MYLERLEIMDIMFKDMWWGLTEPLENQNYTTQWWSGMHRILSNLLHHFLVHFWISNGSASPHHMSLNMMSMIPKRAKYKQLKNNSVTSSIKSPSFLPHLGNHLCCRMWWSLMSLSIVSRH